MLLEGPNIEHQSHGNTTKDHITVILSELPQFDVVKLSRGASDVIRHNKEREAPLPIYLSILIHVKIRKKEIIDQLYNLGLCISYDG